MDISSPPQFCGFESLVNFSKKIYTKTIPKTIVRKNMLMHTNIKKCLNQGVGNNIIT